MRVVDQFGHEVAPGGTLFTTYGYAYRLHQAGEPTYDGCSVGSVVVSAVAFVDDRIVVGPTRKMPADKFAVTVKR